MEIDIEKIRTWWDGGAFTACFAKMEVTSAEVINWLIRRVIKLEGDIACMVKKAAENNLEGYREQGRKIAALLELNKELEAQLLNSSLEIIDMEGEVDEAEAAIVGLQAVLAHSWKRVVFSAEVDEEDNECPACGGYYPDCPCPGPTQDGYEYTEIDGILYAREESLGGE